MRRSLPLLAAALSLALAGCGSRSSLRASQESEKDAEECLFDSDCAADDRCVTMGCRAGSCVVTDTVTCDDDDECTADACDPETGACVHEPLTYDLDGDGHRGPLPGFRPGEPGSCGDDCDDTNPNAYPGAVEVCDGADNDCNGIVDDGMFYTPADGDQDAVRVSGDEMAPAGPSGIAYGLGRYFAAYTGRVAGKDGVYVQSLGDHGASREEELKINGFPADAAGGSVVFTGDRFGIAFHDRRDGDYEVYFNTLKPDGSKYGPDIAITNEWGFSIGASLAFTGREFVVVWQDNRSTESSFGSFHVYGQRLDLDGKLLGENVRLSVGHDADSESPQIAVGRKGLGIVWAETSDSQRRIVFQSFDFELNPIAKAPVQLVPEGRSGVYPTLAWNQASESYLVAFYDPDNAPFAVLATTLDEDGKVLVSTKPITESPRHSRYPRLLPLGDRSLLVFSDDKDQNQGYELYSKMLDASLSPLGPELRLTRSIGDSVFPHASFGPNGDLGVLFRDDREGKQRVYFTRLVCATESP